MLCKAISKVHQDGLSCKTSASAQIRCLQTHSVTVAAVSALPCCQARCRTCLLDPPCSCEYATICWMLVAVKNNRHITVHLQSASLVFIPCLHDALHSVHSILGAGTASKLWLWLYCRRMASRSPSMLALCTDHWNDVLSNVVAVIGPTVAFYVPKVSMLPGGVFRGHIAHGG